MRSFAVLLSLALVMSQSVSLAAEVAVAANDKTETASVTEKADQTSLFRVELEPNAQQSFASLLNEAMRVELVRLTGSRQVFNQPESQYFLDNPKLLLKTYGYIPRTVEGVVVGQNIYFEFDNQRFYELFQKKNLQIWPLAKRPKLLVMMSENLAGSMTYFTSPILDERFDVDFRKVTERLALPVRVPVSEQDWMLPDSELKNAMLLEVLQQQQENYLLSIQLQQPKLNKTTLVWTLYNSQLEILEEKTQPLENNDKVGQALSDMITGLFENFSEPYLASANVLGQFNLEVSGLNQFEALKQVEDFLQSQKPQFRQVKLLSLSKGVAEFDIEYQGEYTAVIDKVQALKTLQLLENNAVIGIAKAQWIDAK
ncbi:DUF2066 domain-containing protein [Thiosulfativibrio zosterae]|uniref:DUF2066 domain-containing protein n=1 Tax=Thiosulfativibrio zosterae TaxID=2675053 RepID=A0A6F8PMQ3_9GAMM|nr:DUF2066 domain-containing protein [Thiosulfativibrio zosterae]BBP43391.1 hypothetical protein THMIRHAT_11370 [Thiosulfativibrio zosterae]